MTLSETTFDLSGEKSTAPLLEVDNLSVSFRTADGTVNAVRQVSYSVSPGETLGIVGESGSGKSVTSLAIMGLLAKSAKVSGSAKFRGSELIGANDKAMSSVRGKNLAMIFQDPMTSLDPVYKIGQQITETLRVHGDISRKDARDRAIELLKIVGIPNAEERVDNYPHEFSGGMRQRVVIAIAMANNPDVIIADEPTTALDVTVQATVLEAIKSAQQETGAALILITHDLGVIAGLADRVMVMYSGRAVEVGTVDDIFYRPRMPYTVGLLNSLPRLDAGGRQRLTPIIGTPPSLLRPPPGCPFAPRCPLHVDDCLKAEPDLRDVDGDRGHRAACIRTGELVGTDTEQAGEVYIEAAEEADMTDDTLPADFDLILTDPVEGDTHTDAGDGGAKEDAQ